MKNIFNYLVACFLTCVFSFSNAQEIKTPATNKDTNAGSFDPAQGRHSRSIDSLLRVLKILIPSFSDLHPSIEDESAGLQKDTTIIKILNVLSYEFYNNIAGYEKALQYKELTLTKIEKTIPFYTDAKLNLFFKKEMAFAFDNFGSIYFSRDNFLKSADNYLLSLKIREEIKDKQGIALDCENLGNNYWYIGDYEKALENYLKALNFYEETEDSIKMANSYFNIGYVYLAQSNYTKAMEHLSKSLKIYERIGSKSGIANSYNGFGDFYEKKGDYKKALENHLQCLKIHEESNSAFNISRTRGNIGNAYFHLGDYTLALDYYLKFLKYEEGSGNKRELADAYASVGSVYLKQNKFQESDDYLQKSLILSKAIGYKDITKNSYQFLSELYEKKGDYIRAFEYLELFSDIKDTLLNEHSGKQIAEMNARYESEKKDKAIQLLNKEKESQATLGAAENRKQQVILFSVSGFSLLLLGFAMIVYRSYRQKQLLNMELEESNKSIENKNFKIIDSITYAQLIQRSILMEENEIQQSLPDSFIYYQPKDIVSGDFYWFSKVNDILILAAIDCTGHGVPGAFMSMIGNTLLNQIVNEKRHTKPSEILRLLNIGIYEALHQQKGGALSHDGMDMALCSIDYKNGEVQYAGAQNPIYVVFENNLEVIKADNHTIGGGSSLTSGFDPVERTYANHIMPIKKGMSIYLFSDGYMDQFGGLNRKKFGIQPFKDLLLNNQNLNMRQQKEKIAGAFEKWKGTTPQIDDVLVIGLSL